MRDHVMLTLKKQKKTVTYSRELSERDAIKVVANLNADYVKNDFEDGCAWAATADERMRAISTH